METIKKHLVKILIGIVALLSGASYLGGGIGATNSVIVLDATIASSTSSTINIDGADRVTLSFSMAGLTTSGTATSTFAVEVSNDETNWVTYNKLVDNVANSISQNLTRVASVAVDSNTTKVYSMDLQNDLFMFMRVTDTIIGTTTVPVTVKALIED